MATRVKDMAWRLSKKYVEEALYRRLFRRGSTPQAVREEVDCFLDSRKRAFKWEVGVCVCRLRRNALYRPALKLSEVMARRGMNPTVSDQAIRLDLVAKSRGIAAAEKLEDTVDFYQTSNPDVPKLFHIDPSAKRPSLVFLKKEEEKLTFYDGEFRASAIADFVSANKLPLVITLTQETAPSIFDNTIKKQACHVVCHGISSLQFLTFKGKLLFVFGERDNEEVGEPGANYFGITGQETTVLAYTGNEDARKFFLDGAITLDKIKS